jgi:hypothetical protein
MGLPLSARSNGSYSFPVIRFPQPIVLAKTLDQCPVVNESDLPIHTGCTELYPGTFSSPGSSSASPGETKGGALSSPLGD